MTEFHYVGYAQEIIFGAGSLARLSEAIDRFHWRRLMLCASNSALRSGYVLSIEAALSERPVAIYNRVQPLAMRFNLEATAPQLAQLAKAIGLPLDNRTAEVAGEAAAQRIHDLIEQMNLPQQLRDVGVSQTDLPNLAQIALRSRAVRSNPKPIQDAAQIEALLEAMW